MTNTTNTTNNPQNRMNTSTASHYPVYQTGEIVCIREWCNEGDRQPYVIVEWNKGRGIISPLEWPHGSIRPTELVTSAMIRRAN